MPMPQRRVRLDSRMCEGHALCLELAPQVFDLTEDDVATCHTQPPDALWDKVKAAVDACPRGAITIESEPYPSALDRAGRTTTP